ncbi:Ig-like domain-containing protein [Lacibacter cauensis]|uniref:Ig-like domain-containing protein n=2 Tax=Lacibacter cauensis TaxID=510947 RepID=A0A562SK29_9BACT|nr:Ig-like domain-containing protein [Lacibacter cauensis]
MMQTNLLFAQNRYAVVISEIMSDPSPQIGLPNIEWIEIRNTTNAAINLQNWRVGDGSGVSGVLPNFLLQPDSCAIICSTTSAITMQQYGRTFGVTSFPSLDNTGEAVFIRNSSGAIVHAVEYNLSWFNNAVKSDGGWTLEMIDTNNPCSGSSNWRASVDARGGTPGSKNSVDAVNSDQQPPALVRAFANSNTVIVSFDEPLDSLSAATAANYALSNGGGTAVAAVCIAPLFNTVQLTFANTLQPGIVYTVTATNVRDCSGNSIGAFNNTKTGLSSAAAANDIIINEILFNPNANGTDYVELYNRSTKLINLKTLLLANRNSTGAIANMKVLTTQDQLLFPGDYLVLSEDDATVKRQFTAKNLSAFINLASMPSYSDDEGTVVLTDNGGLVIDEVTYKDDWHFPLISNSEGVALERIDPNAPSQNKDNWHSAAKDVGYGTPSYQNSQFRLDIQVKGEVTVSPETFSPDNDGTDDLLTINYRFPETGYVMNITVYDAGGRPVKALQRNAVCSQQGTFRWDGLNDKLQQLPLGPYVVFTEVFNLQGKVKRFKNAVVLARRK